MRKRDTYSLRMEIMILQLEQIQAQDGVFVETKTLFPLSKVEHADAVDLEKGDRRVSRRSKYARVRMVITAVVLSVFLVVVGKMIL